MLTARFAAAIDEPWIYMAPLRLGAVPQTIRSADLFVTVERDGEPVLRVDLYRHPDEYRCFEHAAGWQDRLVVGWGEHVHLVWPQTLTHRTISLCGAHFCGFEIDGDRLYVASCERVFRVDPDGFVRWVSEPVGIDGVLLHRITPERIEGDGEHDPPGGWAPFTLHAGTGEALTIE